MWVFLLLLRLLLPRLRRHRLGIQAGACFVTVCIGKKAFLFFSLLFPSLFFVYLLMLLISWL